MVDLAVTAHLRMLMLIWLRADFTRWVLCKNSVFGGGQFWWILLRLFVVFEAEYSWRADSGGCCGGGFGRGLFLAAVLRVYFGCRGFAAAEADFG